MSELQCPCGLSYAAGWFTRYEIIESPLYAENIEEKGDAADDAAKTDLR